MRSNRNNITKELILNTTRELLKTINFSQLTIKEISRSANIRHTVIYYYYENKEAIVKEIYNEEFRILIEKAKNLSLEHQSTREKFIVFLEYFYQVLKKDKVLSNLFYEIIDYSSFDKVHLDKITNMIREGFKEITADTIQVSDDEIKLSIIIWEAGLKGVLRSLELGSTQLSYSEATKTLTKNFLSNIGL